MAKIACSGWRATAAGTRKSARDSSVTLRQLDPIEWYVHQYDEGSGACLIVLGIEPERGCAEESRTEDVYVEDDATRDDAYQLHALKTGAAEVSRRFAGRLPRLLCRDGRPEADINSRSVLRSFANGHSRACQHSSLNTNSPGNGSSKPTVAKPLVRAFDTAALSFPFPRVGQMIRRSGVISIWPATIPDAAAKKSDAAQGRVAIRFVMPSSWSITRFNVRVALSSMNTGKYLDPFLPKAMISARMSSKRNSSERNSSSSKRSVQSSSAGSSPGCVSARWIR